MLFLDMRTPLEKQIKLKNSSRLYGTSNTQLNLKLTIIYPVKIVHIITLII